MPFFVASNDCAVTASGFSIVCEVIALTCARARSYITIKPADRNDDSASRTDMRLAPYRATKSRSDGKRAPGGNTPFLMSPEMLSAMRCDMRIGRVMTGTFYRGIIVERNLVRPDIGHAASY